VKALGIPGLSLYGKKRITRVERIKKTKFRAMPLSKDSHTRRFMLPQSLRYQIQISLPEAQFPQATRRDPSGPPQSPK
jgi:hypothetical protein